MDGAAVRLDKDAIHYAEKPSVSTRFQEPSLDHWNFLQEVHFPQLLHSCVSSETLTLDHLIRHIHRQSQSPTLLLLALSKTPSYLQSSTNCFYSSAIVRSTRFYQRSEPQNFAALTCFSPEPSRQPNNTMLSTLTSNLSILILLFAPSILAYTGDMTYYTPSLGSCGYHSSPNDDVVALAVPMMRNGANPNHNPKCGTKIGIWNPKTKKIHYATVVDTCYGCKLHDIDVSPSLFKKVAPNGNGRVGGINWGGNAVGG